MGITIHYSGVFRSDRSLTEMINEAVAFGESEGWEIIKLSEDFNTLIPHDDPENNSLYGVVLIPPKCESVHLNFDAGRNLGFYSDLRDCIIETWVPENGKEEEHWERDSLPADYKPSWGAHTKTQFAGSAIHRKVVQLLRLISEKYLTNFHCDDETGYWEHGDDLMLMERFGEVPGDLKAYIDGSKN
jgi:hypothetical protein